MQDSIIEDGSNRESELLCTDTYCKAKGGSITTYRTAQIAKMIGVHPNTIRFYEQMALLPAIPRTKNGYRVFSDRHLDQLRLLRTAFRAEIISSRLRQEALEIVKTAALNDFNEAHHRAQNYYQHLKDEKARAEEAIRIVLDIINKDSCVQSNAVLNSRKETAQLLGITADVLRDWERNGLISVPRNEKGIRQYGTIEIDRLKIIRTLRNAHYSMMSVLRMLNRLDQGEMNIKETINTPEDDEDIVSAADRYITALYMAEMDALKILDIIDGMTKDMQSQI